MVRKGVLVSAAGAVVLAGSWYWFDGYVDRVQFFGYIQKYSHVSQAEDDWIDEHHDLVLADGRAFCEWLAEYPEVPDVVPSGEADIGLFRKRYINATADSTDLAVGYRARNTVVAAAGAYFCDDVVESRTSFAVPVEEL